MLEDGDLNHDNELDWPEWKGICNTLFPELDDTKQQKVFNRLDFHGEGVIHYKEVLDLIESEINENPLHNPDSVVDEFFTQLFAEVDEEPIYKREPLSPARKIDKEKAAIEKAEMLQDIVDQLETWVTNTGRPAVEKLEETQNKLTHSNLDRQQQREQMEAQIKLTRSQNKKLKETLNRLRSDLADFSPKTGRDSYIEKLTKQINMLKEQNRDFRTENEQLKQKQFDLKLTQEYAEQHKNAAQKRLEDIQTRFQKYKTSMMDESSRLRKLLMKLQLEKDELQHMLEMMQLESFGPPDLAGIDAPDFTIAMDGQKPPALGGAHGRQKSIAEELGWGETLASSQQLPSLYVGKETVDVPPPSTPPTKKAPKRSHRRRDSILDKLEAKLKPEQAAPSMLGAIGEETGSEEEYANADGPALDEASTKRLVKNIQKQIQRETKGLMGEVTDLKHQVLAQVEEITTKRSEDDREAINQLINDQMQGIQKQMTEGMRKLMDLNRLTGAVGATPTPAKSSSGTEIAELKSLVTNQLRSLREQVSVQQQELVEGLSKGVTATSLDSQLSDFKRTLIKQMSDVNAQFLSVSGGGGDGEAEKRLKQQVKELKEELSKLRGKAAKDREALFNDTKRVASVRAALNGRVVAALSPLDIAEIHEMVATRHGDQTAEEQEKTMQILSAIGEEQITDVGVTEGRLLKDLKHVNLQVKDLHAALHEAQGARDLAQSELRRLQTLHGTLRRRYDSLCAKFGIPIPSLGDAASEAASEEAIKTSAQQEMEGLREKISSLESDQTNYKLMAEQYKQIMREKAGAESMLQMANQQVEDLRGQMEQMQKLQQTLEPGAITEQINQRFQDMLAQQQQLFEKNNTNVSSLAQEGRNALERYVQEIERLREENQTMSETYNRIEAEREMLQNERDGLVVKTQDMEALQEQLDGLTQANRQSQLDLEVARKQIEMLSQQVAETDDAHVRELEARCETYQLKLQDMEAQMVQIQRILREEKETSANQRDALAAVSKTSRTAQAEVHNLDAELSDMRNRLSAAADGDERNQKCITERDEHIHELQADVERLRRELATEKNAPKDSIAILEADRRLQELTRQYNERGLELHTLRSRLDQTTQDKVTVDESKEQLREQIANLEVSLEDVQRSKISTVRSMQQEMEIMRQQVKRLSTELDDYRRSYTPAMGFMVNTPSRGLTHAASARSTNDEGPLYQPKYSWMDR